MSVLAKEIVQILSYRSKLSDTLTPEDAMTLVDHRLSRVRKALGREAMTESAYIEAIASLKIDNVPAVEDK